MLSRTGTASVMKRFLDVHDPVFCSNRSLSEFKASRRFLMILRECRAMARKSRHGWRRKRTKAARKKQAGGLLLERRARIEP